GGFDEQFAVDYNDVDFCLRVGAAGYRIVYTPYAELYHFEGSTLSRSAVDPAEEAAFKARWTDMINNDPHYNPNLPRDRGDCAIDKW
ncbi:MAG: hypothetical protein QOH98_1873, partial [Methylobacteriaceae bacterium]|nr:hypothetical protein [Methylobacteriaceae bacterium]